MCSNSHSLSVERCAVHVPTRSTIRILLTWLALVALGTPLMAQEPVGGEANLKLPKLGSVSCGYTDCASFLGGISGSSLLMAGLVFVVQRTRLGMAMRATAQNPEVAGLMGIDINVVISAAFVIGAALAAVAGLMVMTYYGIAHYYMGFLLGLKAFTAAVLGGIGNLAGAMLGGVLLGIIEALGAGYIGDVSNICGFPFLSDSLQQQCAASDGQVSMFGSNYQDVFAFFVLILVLIFRPSGLLGERVSERA